jgi:hypothetical protein
MPRQFVAKFEVTESALIWRDPEKLLRKKGMGKRYYSFPAEILVYRILGFSDH